MRFVQIQNVACGRILFCYRFCGRSCCNSRRFFCNRSSWLRWHKFFRKFVFPEDIIKGIGQRLSLFFHRRSFFHSRCCRSRFFHFRSTKNTGQSRIDIVAVNFVHRELILGRIGRGKARYRIVQAVFQIVKGNFCILFFICRNQACESGERIIFRSLRSFCSGFIGSSFCNRRFFHGNRGFIFSLRCNRFRSLFKQGFTAQIQGFILQNFIQRRLFCGSGRCNARSTQSHILRHRCHIDLRSIFFLPEWIQRI